MTRMTFLQLRSTWLRTGYQLILKGARGLAILLLILSLFAYVMTHRLSHDEHMYIAAGVLAQHYQLYRNFAYLQMPYLPLVYGFVYQLTGTNYYLLTARLLTFGFAIATLFILYLITYKLSKNQTLALSVCVFMACNEVILEAMAYATNNLMAMAFSFWGFYLLISSLTANSVNPLGVLASGVAIAIAVGTKLYYAALILPFLGVTLAFPANRELKTKINKSFLPFLAGIILGLFPALVYLITDFHRFIFNNLGYHLINTQWRQLTGHLSGMTLSSKLDYGKWIASFPTNLLLAIGVVAILAALFHRPQKLIFKSNLSLYLTTLLSLCSLLAAFSPTPLFIHYFAMPISFMFIGFASSYHLFTFSNQKRITLLVISLAIAAFIINRNILLNPLMQLPQFENWTGIKIHNTSQRIRQALGTINSDTRLATLSPLYALEAGIPIYPELATGPFLYRIGDLISEPQRQQLIATSPQTLPNLLTLHPPTGVFVGFGRNLDQPLIEYATRYHYYPFPQSLNGGRLYLQKNS